MDTKLLILIFSLSFSVVYTDINSEWQNFKKTYGKNYIGDEEMRKFSIFKNNLELVKSHNAEAILGYHSFRLEINHLADLDHVEYANTILNRGIRFPKRLKGLKSVNNTVPIPDSYDWRQKGCVSRVFDQTTCGLSTLFAAIGALEGQECKVRTSLVPLSYQQLFDCCSVSSDPVDYFECVETIVGGVDSSACYKNRGQCVTPGQCRFEPQCVAVRPNGYGTIRDGNELTLRNSVVLIGPIAVGIDASQVSFQLYSSGIYDDPLCQNIIDHMVLIVGYGSENGKDYWIVKNSWGENWGENGYIRMSRNNGNQCGIASFASYPTL